MQHSNLFQRLTLDPSPILHKWREALDEAGMTDSPEKTSGNPPTLPGPLTVCDPSPLTRTNAKLQSDLCTQTDGEDTKPPTPPTTFLCGLRHIVDVAKGVLRDTLFFKNTKFNYHTELRLHCRLGCFPLTTLVLLQNMVNTRYYINVTVMEQTISSN